VEPRHRLHLLIRALVLAAPLWGAAGAGAKTYLTRSQALELAFPKDAKVERKTSFLTDAQADAAKKKARAPLDSKVWTYYQAASSTGAPLGWAYFETHPVRTMTETILVAIGPDGTVRFIEVLAFAEPERRRLDDELALRRGLRGITGSTLTAEAVAQGARRVLAVHEVIHSGAP
jgi:hypothetical protein